MLCPSLERPSRLPNNISRSCPEITKLPIAAQDEQQHRSRCRARGLRGEQERIPRLHPGNASAPSQPAASSWSGSGSRASPPRERALHSAQSSLAAFRKLSAVPRVTRKRFFKIIRASCGEQAKECKAPVDLILEEQKKQQQWFEGEHKLQLQNIRHK